MFNNPDMGDLGERPGVSPITQQGRVVLNAFKDDEEVENRRQRMAKNASFYGGSDTRDHVFTILQGEIVLAHKQRLAQPGSAMGQVIKGLSALNGLGDKNDTKESLIEQLVFLGFSQIQYQHRSQGTGSDTAIVLVRGGRFTIPHTGFHKINQGDLIFWDIPERGQGSKRYGDSPAGKIVAMPVRYDPDVHGTTKEALHKRLSDLICGKTSPSAAKTGMTCYAATFHEGFMTAALAVHQIIQEEFSGVGLHQLENYAKCSVRSAGDREKAKNFQMRVIDAVFGKESKEPSLYKQFKDPNALRVSGENMLCGLAGQANFINRRILGEATAPAVPGRTIDILPFTYGN